MSFDPVTFLFLIPALAAVVIALMPGSKLSAYVNAGASFLTFLAGLSLLWVERPAPGAYVLVDEFNTIFVVLITFVSFTTSVFSATYVEYELETGRVTPAFLKLYHALYQALTLCFVLALLSNNIGVMWVAIELATLTTVVMVGIYRTHAAIEAAWKYFILASVGIALALFGTILVYMAAEPVMGAGLNAMVWTDLVARAASLEPAMLNLAFVFLLLGYGTKIGLFPLHAWLPDAHAEGPTPITAVLSGLLLNVALYALLRCKMLLAGNPEALAPGPLMIGMGLVSLLFGAFMLYRRRDIKRLFAYSSIEHMGLITFAFGLGGPIANFAGLLHMALHSLTKSAIFFAVGDISQVKGTQKIADMGGLTTTNPLIGWGLVIGVAAIAGLPPLGMFTSEFLMVSATLAKQPLLALPARARAADRHRRIVPAIEPHRLRRAEGTEPQGEMLLCPDDPPSRARAHRGHLSARNARRLVPGRGQAARIGKAMAPLTDIAKTGRKAESHRPWPRAIVGSRRLAARDRRSSVEARATLLGLWGDKDAVHLALLEELSGAIAVFTLACPDGKFPSVGAHHPAAIRLERTIPDLYGLKPTGAADTQALARSRLLGRDARRSASARKRAIEAYPYAFLPVEGEDLHQIPVGPVHAGIIEPGHFRFTANGEAVVRLEQRLGYVHKGTESLMTGASLDKGAKLAGRTSGDSTVAYALAFAQAVEVGAPDRAFRRAPCGYAR